MNQRFLAFMCSVCPFCTAARLFPNSKLAKKLHEVEKDCPACNAYYKLRIAPKQDKTSE